MGKTKGQFEMEVIEIGDILTRNGERLCGIFVEASRDELAEGGDK